MSSLIIVGGASPAAASNAPSGVIQVEAGGNHTCALLGDGSIKCWGKNDLGQLGDGSITNSAVPVSVSGINNAIQISVGSNHSCALLQGGTVECWGSNVLAQVGNGTSASNALLPKLVGGLDNVVQISAGSNHNCAVLAAQTVKCWGNNAFGQLGDGATMTTSKDPHFVTGLTLATQVSVGADHSCAIYNSGSVACWGSNLSDQLGDGTGSDSTSPVGVDNVSSATQLASGAGHSCVLEGSSMKCWGSSSRGQLGDGTNSGGSAVPVGVVGIAVSSQIAAGFEHSCAVTGEGDVMCWGSNNLGQLGNGTLSSTSTPQTTTGLSDIIQVSAGTRHSCAVPKHGPVVCWGNNANGELGNGLLIGKATPVEVTGLRSYGNCRAEPVDPVYGTQAPSNGSVYRLYCAYFLRYPDVAGFEYWLDQYQQGTVGFLDISDLFAASEEFQFTYGGLSDSEFLTLVYQNVVERLIDPQGFDYWLNLLDTGELTRGDVMFYFSDSLEFRNKTGTPAA